MLTDDRLHGLKPNSSPPHCSHHEEAAEDAHRAGQVADDREPYGPVLRSGEDVAGPVPVIERRGSVGQRARRLNQPMKKAFRPDSVPSQKA